MPIISYCFLLLFIAFSMLSSIKIYIGGDLNWLILLFFLITSVTNYLISKKAIAMKIIIEKLHYLKVYKIMLLGWLLFIIGIGVAAFLNQGTGLYTIVKYLTFIFILMCLLLTPLSPTILQKTLNLTLMVSLIPLIILILSRQSDAIVILGDGRMGWVASWPGVIWKIGAIVWPFALWQCLKKAAPFNVLLAFCSILIIAIDGSRTAIIWFAFIWVFLTGISIFTKTHTKPLLTHFSLLIITFITFSLIQPLLLGWVLGQYDPSINGLLNETQTINIPEEKTVDRLFKGDTSTRLQMLNIGWQQTLNSFPWGNGFGNTRTDDFGVSSVIHMTYLQLLADTGIISLVGYLLFLLAPLYYGFKFLTEKPELFVERFELILSPLSILILFLFMGLFHPISNELTEWTIVLTAISVLINHVPRYN
ncbi:hypothetical protein ABN067_21995 [Providencia rettgeri]